MLSSMFDISQGHTESIKMEETSEGNGDNSVYKDNNSVYKDDDYKIRQELEVVSAPARANPRLQSKKLEDIILKLCMIKPLPLKELANLVNRTSDGIRNNYLRKLVNEGKIELTIRTNKSS